MVYEPIAAGCEMKLQEAGAGMCALELTLSPWSNPVTGGARVGEGSSWLLGQDPLCGADRQLYL